MANELTVRFWGVRGSIANGGPEFAGVGGNTSCVEVRAGEERIILDAGTGLRALGETMPQGSKATFLFSHLHWDHIQGFPFFTPAYVPGNEFVLFGPGKDGLELRTALETQMTPPSFPVTLGVMGAKLRFRSLQPGETIAIGEAKVRAATLHHPQGCLGYRIELGRKAVVYATDTEPREAGVPDPAALALAKGADLLICDAQYTDDEYGGRVGPSRKGWGHSTVRDACRLAEAAGVRQLALFHHDPTHDDRTLERLVHEARAFFPNVAAAREGMTVSL
jgi:phosphoribosyl 1,2-cyclic phosphodiesterase